MMRGGGGSVGRPSQCSRGLLRRGREMSVSRDGHGGMGMFTALLCDNHFDFVIVTLMNSSRVELSWLEGARA